MVIAKRDDFGDKSSLLKHLEENFTETEKTILNRRSVRLYRKDQVPEFLIKRILQAACYAPSAGNCQPWKFVVIREPKIIEELTKDVITGCKIVKSLMDYREPGSSWKKPIAKLYTRLKPNNLHPVPFSIISLIAEGKQDLFYGAPTVILIFKDIRGVTNPDLDCGIAGQNMALAAHSMGLGTCWIGFTNTAFEFKASKWDKIFDIQYPYQFLTSMAVGWPMGNPGGMVERPGHSISWFENGEKKTLTPGKYDSGISLAEKMTMPNYDDPAKIRWGEIVIDDARCNGCAYCSRCCPSNAIAIKDKKAQMPIGSACLACGDCTAICPEGAIRLKSSYSFSDHFKTIDHGELKLPVLI